MNIPRHHVELLMEFGYTEPEAQFLYVVATHSGYFTLRQYLSFTGAHRGKRSSLFAHKILNTGHAWFVTIWATVRSIISFRGPFTARSRKGISAIAALTPLNS